MTEKDIHSSDGLFDREQLLLIDLFRGPLCVALFVVRERESCKSEAIRSAREQVLSSLGGYGSYEDGGVDGEMNVARRQNTAQAGA